MSVAFTPVGWNRTKIVYDAVLIAGIALYLFVFDRMVPPAAEPLDLATRTIKAWGSLAFVLLTLILAIGPLARLDRRFLPLLYNRRHFGVITCAVAVVHAASVVGWYFAFSPADPYAAMFASDAGFGSLGTFPYVPFGILALLILFLLAATSHDFWLDFLGPPAWKAIHMSIYAAYAAVVCHVAFGALQDARSPGLPVLVFGGAAVLIGLHLAAGWRGRSADAPLRTRSDDGSWFVAGTIDQTVEGRAFVVRPPDGEAVAIFRDGGTLSAITNVCAHQNGPLGEGRVLDGCVTCPWHGFQFRLVDGCAPAPFTDKIATYRLRLDGRTILLDPRPNPPGTPVEPVRLPTGSEGAAA